MKEAVWRRFEVAIQEVQAAHPRKFPSNEEVKRLGSQGCFMHGPLLAANRAWEFSVSADLASRLSLLVGQRVSLVFPGPLGK